MNYRSGVLACITLLLILSLSNCKSSTLTHCPDLASVPKSRPHIIAFKQHHNQQAKSLTPVGQAVNASAPDTNTQKSVLIASSIDDMPIKVKMPNAFAQKVMDGDLDDMNKLLASYSNNKITLQRSDKGKLYLRAHSLQDIFAIHKNGAMPEGIYERHFGPDPGDGSKQAYLSKLFGYIAFPLLLAGVFPGCGLAIAAIVMAKRGWRSKNHKMAVTGLMLGIIALAIPILALLIFVPLAIFLVG